MVNYFEDTLMYCNRERTRKCERYARKHKCTFIEAFNALYGTNYKYTYQDKMEMLSRNTSVNTNNRRGKL